MEPFSSTAVPVNREGQCQIMLSRRPNLSRIALRTVGALATITFIAACGSQTKPVSGSTLSGDLHRALRAAHRQPGARTRVRPGPRAPSRTYRLHLTGADPVPHGAPAGTADVVVRLVRRPHENDGQVCWTFANLDHFDRPTQAFVHEGGKGNNGPAALLLGAYWKSHGCTAAANQLMIAIAKAPSRYYIDIRTTHYATGAVRTQL